MRSDLAVWIDGRPPVDAVSVLIGRTHPYTFFKRWGVKVTPNARMDGGLEVLAVRKLTRRSLGRVAWQVLVTGSVVKRRNIEYTSDVSSVEIVGRRPYPVQVDGDYIGHLDRVSVRLAPSSLEVIA
jgi:diacylglycerol kinase family enzyme